MQTATHGITPTLPNPPNLTRTPVAPPNLPCVKMHRFPSSPSYPRLSSRRQSTYPAPIHPSPLEIFAHPSLVPSPYHPSRRTAPIASRWWIVSASCTTSHCMTCSCWCAPERVAALRLPASRASRSQIVPRTSGPMRRPTWLGSRLSKSHPVPVTGRSNCLPGRNHGRHRRAGADSQTPHPVAGTTTVLPVIARLLQA